MRQASAQLRSDRRSEILDAAQRCFARTGFHQTSMQQVCSEAGMSAGNVYRYFPSKEAIIAGIATFCRYPRLEDVTAANKPVDWAIYGVPFDSGITYRPGARFGPRADLDVQLLWEFKNLGLGNRALVEERRAQSRLAEIELFRVQDRVAAEVAQAYAQAQSAAARLAEAETEVKDAVESANQNLEFLGQTTGDKKLAILIIRPQEVVTAVQAVAQAYNDYYAAVADYDRAQFRLYRALGQPAEWLTCGEGIDTAPGGPGPLDHDASRPGGG